MTKTDTNNSEDEQLLPLIAEGNKLAFDTVFRKYYQPLCAYAYRFVEFESVEEIVQDVLLWLWQNAGQLTIRDSLRSYLFQAVHLRCLSKIQQNTARQRAISKWQQEHADNLHIINIDDMETAELVDRIHKAIESLPESYREAFVLHRFHDKTYKEIATKLNVSPKTVDYRIQQALKLLKEDLKEYFPILLLILTA